MRSPGAAHRGAWTPREASRLAHHREGTLFVPGLAEVWTRTFTTNAPEIGNLGDRKIDNLGDDDGMLRVPIMVSLVGRDTERAMSQEASEAKRHDEQSRLERRIEATDRLLRESVECLSRHHPTHSVGAAAYGILADLRPRLEEALSALEDIERERELTDEEYSRQRAFRIVLRRGDR